MTEERKQTWGNAGCVCGRAFQCHVKMNSPAEQIALTWIARVDGEEAELRGRALTLCLVNWDAWQFKLRLLGELNWPKYCIFHVFLMTLDRLLYIPTAQLWNKQQHVKGSTGVLLCFNWLTGSFISKCFFFFLFFKKLKIEMISFPCYYKQCETVNK